MQQKKKNLIATLYLFCSLWATKQPLSYLEICADLFYLLIPLACLSRGTSIHSKDRRGKILYDAPVFQLLCQPALGASPIATGQILTDIQTATNNSWSIGYFLAASDPQYSMLES